jgi:hypothetical protein
VLEGAAAAETAVSLVVLVLGGADMLLLCSYLLEVFARLWCGFMRT